MNARGDAIQRYYATHPAPRPEDEFCSSCGRPPGRACRPRANGRACPSRAVSYAIAVENRRLAALEAGRRATTTRSAS